MTVYTGNNNSQRNPVFTFAPQTVLINWVFLKLQAISSSSSFPIILTGLIKDSRVKTNTSLTGHMTDSQQNWDKSVCV